MARRTPAPRPPWPARFRRRTDEYRGYGSPGYRRWPGSWQSADGGTRSGQARAPDHASAGYRSWTWLLLVSDIAKIVIAKIVASEIGLKKIAAILVPRRQSKLANLVAHRTQAYAQQLGRPRPVAACGFESHGKKLALHFSERQTRLPLRGTRQASGQTLPLQAFPQLEGFNPNLVAAR